MLLVDFNLAEHLGPEAVVPEIPDSPDRYAEVHPDRVEKFPDAKRLVIYPKEIDDNERDDRWRHELDHDAESVFWLILYWAMVVQPEECRKETIDSTSWTNLLGNFEKREALIREIPTNLTHSFYKPLQPLIKDLAAILVIDSHWLKAPDPRKDTFYVTEAFQRLILKFMIENRGKEFMDHPAEKAFREVEGAQHSNAKSTTGSEIFDSANRLVNSSVKPISVCSYRCAYGCAYRPRMTSRWLVICAEDLKRLASQYLHSPSTHVDKLRMRRRRPGGLKVLILLEIDDTMSVGFPNENHAYVVASAE
jgi:hypothetical protein